MKITVSNKRDFTEWGGLIPIVNELYGLGIPDLVDSAFETDKSRVEQCKYKFSDVVTSLISSALCGGVRIDNITGLKKELELIPGLNIPSHDTMGRLMKQMASKEKIKDVYQNDGLKKNYYDDNIRLNKLLIQISKKMGCFEEGKEYILDADCTFINTRCAGAKSAEGIDQFGFYPLVCFIGNFPIFFSNRNGNSSDRFRIAETIEMCINLLEEENIKIKMVRMDGAGYNTALYSMLHEKNIKFLSTAPVNTSFKKMWRQIDDSSTWTDVKIETATSFKECQICDIPYTMNDYDATFRVVIARIPTENTIEENETDEEKEFRLEIENKMQMIEKKGLLKTNDKRYISVFWKVRKSYKYKLFMTNDYISPAEDVIAQYNLRGDMEKQFSYMKQDFGWKWPPFKNMNENTVFFILTAIANNVYRGFHKKFTKHIPEIELNARVNNFRKNFIKVLCYFLEDNSIEYRGTEIDFTKIC